MNTTIQINRKTKEQIQSFGTKGETFDDIIRKIYGMAVKQQLREFLMSSEDTTPIEEALARAKKKWQK